MNRSEAIKAFLTAKTHADLAGLYNRNMEVQVIVAQDGGQRVAELEGDYRGRNANSYTDGMTTWRPFRIPAEAHAVPVDNDYKLNYDMEAHALGIGMTGWDWLNRVSRWVAYDFDAISSHHSDKHLKQLADHELDQIREQVTQLPWVTIRKSTSGKGLHLYVFTPEVSTENHTEHAALGRAILGMMSAITGFDFSAKVDICGGNMWVWHRKMLGTDGLSLIKQGEVLRDIPPNWRDHVKVVTRRKNKVIPQWIEEQESTDAESAFMELCGQRPKTPLDDDHKKLIQWFHDNGATSWWEADHHMLVTHTYWLKQAHEELGLKGHFETMATGKEKGCDHNCFAFPLRNGAWAIRRYSRGVKEHDSWEQDGAGWTRCFYNKEPDLHAAARMRNGLERPSGGYEFIQAGDAQAAALMLGADLGLPPWVQHKQAVLKESKDGRLVVEVARDGHEPEPMKGWIPSKGKWTRIFNIRTSGPTESEVSNFPIDDIARHLVTEGGQDSGWVIKGETRIWRDEPLTHVKTALAGSMSLKSTDVTTLLGNAIMRAWTIVNRPFEDEYPGGRTWNRNAAQFRYPPTKGTENLTYPNWLKVLNHCGHGLNEALKTHPWARANGITSGGDYLKVWLASMFKEPTQPLPYLFLYGPQDSGKSILHEAISECLITGGVSRADTALKNKSDFNGELEHAVLCVVEETDLKKDMAAYNKIKDWVTARQLPIHKKNQTPYLVVNTTHWVQTANNYAACPVFPGDTRITMTYVPNLDPLEMIPKKQLMELLKKEAPDFLASVLALEIPASNDRLNVPVVITDEKIGAEAANKTMLELFLEEMCHHVPGEMLKFSDIYERFREWIDPNLVDQWSKVKVGRELPPQYPRGLKPGTGETYVGNISWEAKQADKPSLTVRDKRLVVHSLNGGV